MTTFATKDTSQEKTTVIMASADLDNTLAGNTSAPATQAPSFDDLKAEAMAQLLLIFDPPQGMTPAECLHAFLDYLDETFVDEEGANGTQEELFDRLTATQQAAYKALLQELTAVPSPAVDDDEENEASDDDDEEDELTARLKVIGSQLPSLGPLGNQYMPRLAELYRRNQASLAVQQQIQQLELDAQAATATVEQQLAASDSEKEEHIARQERHRRLSDSGPDVQALKSDLQALDTKLERDILVLEAEVLVEAALADAEHYLSHSGTREVPEWLDEAEQKAEIATYMDVDDGIAELQRMRDGQQQHFHEMIKAMREMMHGLRTNTLDASQHPQLNRKAKSLMQGVKTLRTYYWLIKWAQEVLQARRAEEAAQAVAEKENAPTPPRPTQKTVACKLLGGPELLAAVGPAAHVAREVAHESKVMGPLVRLAKQKTVAHKRFGKQGFDGADHTKREQASEAAVTAKHRQEMQAHKAMTMTQLQKMSLHLLLATVLKLRSIYQLEKDTTRKARLGWANGEVHRRQQLAEGQE